jgi:hypothetical protein
VGKLKASPYPLGSPFARALIGISPVNPLLSVSGALRELEIKLIVSREPAGQNTKPGSSYKTFFHPLKISIGKSEFIYLFR